jgi:predicted RNA-binding Zn ribbon-like protein
MNSHDVLETKPMSSRQSAIATKTALTKPIATPVGGHLALDFCNTAGEHLAPHPDEMLVDWESFLRWTTQSGLIAPETYSELLRHPSPIDRVVQLREAIYRVGLAISRGLPIPRRDLLAIREQANVPKPSVVISQDGLRWRPGPKQASEQLLAILAGEALSLFCSPRSSRIGICEGGLCGWLFVDESRGKRRRWCDMKDCGNRAKARRYYQQQHKSE